ncbi:GNAT family N-acetyltransferase [Cohnella caldifontis]|uniref:GNAT family N-acetyltransferase n=1 Tax=Cohnella caldifontis TaxID=3027471 RepID=UPI0023EC3FC4|nr:GNAT family N-acetyltransferase [Cohnella sp. YIM B05605]
MEIRQDDLNGPEVRALIADHLRSMFELSPPESVHALDADRLKRPDVTFWSAWERGELAGIGALKELDGVHGEIKSMKTAPSRLRRDVASRLLERILEEAKRRGYKRVSLETGSMEAFEPARRLYARYGFQLCGPFADYGEDPNSVFMTLEL